MKKLTAFLCASALVTIFPATPALADGAVITPDGVCGGFVPNEDGSAGDFLLGNISLSNATKSGNLNITCKFDVPDDLVPSKTRKASGFICGFPNGSTTTNSRMVVTPGGSGSLTCKKRG
jgi:hypothetical protein